MAFAKTDTLVGKLRRARPAYLLVHLEDSEGPPTRINMQEHSKRTQIAMATLNDMAWRKIEMFDKKDGLVGTHTRTADDEPAPGELETIGDRAQGAGRAAELAALANINLRSQEMVLSYVSKMFQPLLDAFTKQNESVSRRLDVAQRDADRVQKENIGLQAEILRAGAKIAASRIGAGGDDDSPMSEEALAQLMPEIIKHMFGGGAKESASNGPASNGASNGHAKPNPAGDPPRRGRQQDKSS